MTWSASDLSGICRYDLELSSGGAFAPVPLTSATATSITREHAFGQLYQYRVRATDCAGNTSAYRTAKAFTPYVDDGQPGGSSGSGSDLVLDPDWTRLPEPGELPRHALLSLTPGSRVTYRAYARRVSWIAPRSPDRGSARVSVNGLEVAIVDLSASTRRRGVVWQKRWSSPGNNRIVVEVLEGRVDVDAFAILR